MIPCKRTNPINVCTYDHLDIIISNHYVELERDDKMIMIPITWQGECSCSWLDYEEVLQVQLPTLDAPQTAASCAVVVLDTGVNVFEPDSLCVVEDMVLWHMVVDHWHAMMVPNKCCHCGCRPAVFSYFMERYQDKDLLTEFSWYVLAPASSSCLHTSGFPVGSEH